LSLEVTYILNIQTLSLLEIAGFIFGIAGIWLTIQGSVWCFPVGLANVILSLFLFFEQKLYSDAIQQAVYIILLSYGWVNWLRKPGKTVLMVSKSSARMLLPLIVITILIAAAMGYYFDKYTDADFPFLDAIATALSFAAQYLVARKKIENWIIWIAVNLLYIGIYFQKDLYLYALLFIIYFCLALFGYSEWKKLMNRNNEQYKRNAI
jgi:nicotinamide mononucleotide transporter